LLTRAPTEIESSHLKELGLHPIAKE